MPEDVVTPVVICPTCGELIAVREEPRPIEIPQPPEQSEAVSAHRSPDRQDVVGRPTGYRSPLEPPSGPLNPAQRATQVMVLILVFLLPVGLVMLGLAPWILHSRVAEQTVFGALALFLVFLFVMSVILWRFAAVMKDEKQTTRIPGALVALCVLMVVVLTLMCFVLTVCDIH
jgi:hypothetical protein